MRTERWTDVEHVEARRIERGNAEADTVKLYLKADGCREELDLSEQVAEIVGREIADALGYYYVAHGALTPGRAKLVDELEEAEGSWDRASVLLNRAAHELIGRGCSTTAEETAVHLIGMVEREIGEELQRLHGEEAQRHREAAERRRASADLAVECGECNSWKVEKTREDPGGGVTFTCLECGADFGPRRALFTEVDRGGSR